MVPTTIKTNSTPEYRWVYNKFYHEFNLYDVSGDNELGGWAHIANTKLDKDIGLWRISIGLGPVKQTFGEQYATHTDAISRLHELLGYENTESIKVDDIIPYP